MTDIGYQQNMSDGRHLGTITIKTNIFIDKAASTHVIDFQATKVNEPRPRTGIKRKSTFVNIWKSYVWTAILRNEYESYLRSNEQYLRSSEIKAWKEYRANWAGN